MKYVVDTCIWVRLLRKENQIKERLAQTLKDEHEVIVSPVVYYELIRGLEKRGDTQSVAFMLQLWSKMTYVEMSKEIWDVAIRLWVDAVRRNRKQEDADTLIAAAAFHLGAAVVTDNIKNFQSFSIPVEDWGQKQ